MTDSPATQNYGNLLSDTSNFTSSSENSLFTLESAIINVKKINKQPIKMQEND